MSDTTVRQDSEQGLKARIAALEAELDSLTYAISHDLRAPLRAIEGFSRALAEDYEGVLDPQGADYLHRINRASVKVTRMVDGLLRLSRIGRRQLVPAASDLSSDSEAVLRALQAAHPEHSVEWQVAPGITARGDPELLRMLLDELLTSAWLFTANRSPALIEFYSRQDSERTIFCIHDNGVGFDATIAEKLFRPFQTLPTEVDHQGTGIGLAIAKKIVDRHLGSLWAESAPGQGASFFFTLGDADE